MKRRQRFIKSIKKGQLVSHNGNVAEIYIIRGKNKRQPYYIEYVADTLGMIMAVSARDFKVIKELRC